MPNLTRFVQAFWDLDSPYVFDHFTEAVVTGDRWTTLVADTTPTVTTPDAVNGLARLFTDTTDNNEVAIRSTIELFKFGTNREIVGRAKIQYTENDTNKANVFVGFGSAIGANFLVDNGAGPRVTGDIFGIFKVDGGTVWKCITQTNGTATTTTTNKTAGGAAAQTVELVAEDHDGVTMSCSFYVDGQILRDANNVPIVHKAVIASATEMNIGVYVKTGGGAGGETLDVDYLGGVQTLI